MRRGSSSPKVRSTREGWRNTEERVEAVSRIYSGIAITRQKKISSATVIWISLETFKSRTALAADPMGMLMCRKSSPICFRIREGAVLKSIQLRSNSFNTIAAVENTQSS